MYFAIYFLFVCLFVAGVTVSQAGLREEAKASPYAKSATILWPESFMAASPRCFPYTTACLLDELVLGLCCAGHGSLEFGLPSELES